MRTAATLAGGLMRACSAVTAEGTIWEVDAGLRPEGKAGPLVRTLPSHRAYYERWAKTWEFQALLKARPIAGDRALGESYVAELNPLVWQAAARENFVTDVQAMRRRVEEHAARGAADRQLKLGPGGLRDVEFAVQLLQLVHGRHDESLRSANTLEALAALAEGGYVGLADAAALDAAYRFLRTLEHRIQLHRLRRTHVVPEADAELRRLGRSLGFTADPAVDLQAEWRRHAREVRRLHEKLFYRPLLQAVARLDPGAARLTPEAARARLQALGYADPAGALRHLEALTAGVSRRAAIQRTLLPVLLGWFAGAADPDAGLLGFRQVSDSLGATPWYLRLLRDEGAAAQRLAQLLASSRFATDLLLRAPDAVAMLADDAELTPREGQAISAEVLFAVRRQQDPEAAAAAARAVRRREVFRIAAGDVLGRLDVATAGRALTDVAIATVAGGLEAATRAVESARGGPLPMRLAVVAMGRFGGGELGYASDADVMFVCEPLPDGPERAALEAAHAVAMELRRLLALPAPDPPLVVDADLRPEGRQGPLVRTLASYAAYYERWSHVWESQALLRALPIAGDQDLGERFVALIEPLRHPPDGLDDAAVREIRRIKARVEAERLPRGADPTTHTKLGRGGLADVEWTVQLLQLQHAAAVPDLRTTATLPALAAAVAAGLVAADDAAVLGDAWMLAARVRNAILLVRGRAADSLPTDLRKLAGVARLLGYPPGGGAALVDDYRRTTRRARTVVERLFYGA
jgi:glutamate-ammonia-ligase adenylyltransferase